MKTKMTFALMAILTSSAFAAFQAPLPEFKNEKQLAEWRAEMAAKDTAQTTTEDTAFYTGKPYLESSGSYAFKYRSYNPELARWTSEDPSGFPDGANSQVFVPAPSFMFDSNGLYWVKYMQIFARTWETDVIKHIATNRTVDISGISQSNGWNSNGPTGAVTINYSFITTSNVIDESTVTTLTNRYDDPIPSGDDWEKFGDYTMYKEENSKRLIKNNVEVGDDIFLSQWKIFSYHQGYQMWHKWLLE